MPRRSAIRNIMTQGKKVLVQPMHLTFCCMMEIT